MKQIAFLLALCLMPLSLASCSDDENEGSAFNTYLSGKYTVDGADYQLVATLDGAAVTDKNASVTLRTSDNESATMTLSGLIAGHASVTVPLTLAPSGESGRFTFSGEKTESDVTVACSGYAYADYSKGHLHLTLTTAAR